MDENPMRRLRVRLPLALRILLRPTTLHVPPGHPYSPIPAADDVTRALRRAEVAGRELPGIDLREREQLQLLDRLLPLYGDLPFRHEPGIHRYHYGNPYFTYSDAIFYSLMLRNLRPAQVIEVGSGFSSALALDINELFLGGRTCFTFIEPDPRRLQELLPMEDLEGRLIASPVQDVPLRRFEGLRNGDILFIDSSHTMKAGSDVQHLLDEVLPRLATGVRVHIHDIFYPFEYPAGWLAVHCAVNEAYAVRALLQFSRAYEIVLWNSFLERFRQDWFQENMPLVLRNRYPTGGLWLRRC